MQNNSETDRVVIEGRKTISMTNVGEVDGFTDQYIKITVSNTKAIICGENLKIVSYSKESGNLIADGKINEIKYSYKKQPILKRLLK